MYKYSKIYYLDKNGLVVYLTYAAAVESGHRFTPILIPYYEGRKRKEGYIKPQEDFSINKVSNHDLAILGELLYKMAERRGEL